MVVVRHCANSDNAYKPNNMTNQHDINVRPEKTYDRRETFEAFFPVYNGQMFPTNEAAWNESRLKVQVLFQLEQFGPH